MKSERIESHGDDAVSLRDLSFVSEQCGFDRTRFTGCEKIKRKFADEYVVDRLLLIAPGCTRVFFLVPVARERIGPFRRSPSLFTIAIKLSRLLLINIAHLKLTYLRFANISNCRHSRAPRGGYKIHPGMRERAARLLRVYEALAVIRVARVSAVRAPGISSYKFLY